MRYKYAERTFYQAAFDDGELYVDEQEFTLDELEKCKALVKKKNAEERKRLGGKEPDAFWFVLKMTTQPTVAWKDFTKSGQSPKKKVVVKTTKK